MNNPSPEAYLRFAARAMPDPVSVARQLSEIITFVQGAQGALNGNQPEDRSRASVALTAALAALGLLSMEFGTAAKRWSADS